MVELLAFVLRQLSDLLDSFGLACSLISFARVPEGFGLACSAVSFSQCFRRCTPVASAFEFR